MEPTDERVETIFHGALEHSDLAARNAFLSARCEGDIALEARVRRLLALSEGAGGMLEAAPPPDGIELEIERLKPEEIGDQIGPYKLRERIGEGGFGSVWVAEQERPIRRRVALKILKLGMDTVEVTARFEQERQALSMMDHPNIARVFDAGATKYGRPYFVMELVRGVKITDYCDEQALSMRERIELFIAVCQAVQHAHQKGIIHRDLKPSNILVTINDGVAVPKVIDFGVAKAMQGRLSERTIYTQFHQMIGTPLYMSPEQAELTSLDIDTRSDVYSLGVLLYELLTGRTPIDAETLREAGLDEMRRIIREVDPPLPSARVKTFAGNELTSAAKRRHVEPAKLPGALRGDLDWIVMKCLEKDRNRRYETANGLALDLGRHLEHAAVTARPPTAMYVLSRLVRRNKRACAAGAALAVTLVVGGVVSTWQAVRANRALTELREGAPAFADQARALAAAERFDEAIEKLNYAAKLRPDVSTYLVEKGFLLQSQMKLHEAAACFWAALRVQPGLPGAERAAQRCEHLAAGPRNEQGRPSLRTLQELLGEMQFQQRPPAELMSIAKLIGEETKILIPYWLDRLKHLPISPDRPLDKRLQIKSGFLSLDLSATNVADLSALKGMPLDSLNLADCKALRSIEPLSEVPTLIWLSLSKTQISDLRPLRGLPLEHLFLSWTEVADISPLRDRPLQELSLFSTRVSDLSPLLGMPLSELDLSHTPALDFSPLGGLPLEKLYLQKCRIRDLSVLRGMPLRELVLWGCRDARGYSVLSDCKNLQLLLLPSQYRALPTDDYAAIAQLRSLPQLRQIGSEIMNEMSYASTGSAEVFWREWEREQTFVPALRSSGFLFDLIRVPSGIQLSMDGQPVRDLSFLKGAPITELFLASARVADLTPIRDLRLRTLNLFKNPVTDLSPLRGMPLEDLGIAGTQISDLSPLAGLPLKHVGLNSCERITDVSNLAKIPTLETIVLPPRARGVEHLRLLPGLKLLSFQVEDRPPYRPNLTAERFWKMWDNTPWQRALRERGVQFTAEEHAEEMWHVTITTKEFSDCSVFKGARIRELILDNTSVADLRPLADLPLVKLSFSGTPVTDISPLGSPVLRQTLRDITMFETRVADFSPLSGCANLEALFASGTLLSDLTFLRGRQMIRLGLGKTKVTDISMLAGMPLDKVWLDGTAVTDISPLFTCVALAELLLPAGARDVEKLRALPALKTISYDYNGGKISTTAEFWKTWDNAPWHRALSSAGVKFAATQEPDELWRVHVQTSAFSDCSVFKGAQIKNLSFYMTSVADLRPLMESPLEVLGLEGTQVIDLSPLRARAISSKLREVRLYKIPATDFTPVAALEKLEHFDASTTALSDLSIVRGRKLRVAKLAKTRISDISVLANMPLECVTLNGTEVTDLSPLLTSRTLRQLVLPKGAHDVEKLRGLPTLEEISYDEKAGGAPTQSAAAFWAEFDRAQRRTQP